MMEFFNANGGFIAAVFGMAIATIFSGIGSAKKSDRSHVVL